MNLIGFYSKKNLYKLTKFDYYKKSFSKLKKNNINIIYFYQEEKDTEIDLEIFENIKKMWVTVKSFNKEEEIIKYLKKLSWKIFINTFEEQEIKFVNKIRKSIHQKITNKPKIFLNKYLQREIIGKIYPETTVRFKKFSLEDAKKIKKTDLPKTPFIIKPTGWIQSSGVCKINNYKEYKTWLKTIEDAFKKLAEKKLLNQEVLIEEFIDGKMYTIDYYIDEEQNIKSSKPVFVALWIDYNIEDFCNISRIISKEIEQKVNKNKLEEFIKKTVIWWWIKNTFIHHEFKINSKWEYKTIEINGRIWWYRLDMYQLWYDIDLLTIPFFIKGKDKKLKNNIAAFALYPKEEWIFDWFNEQLIKKIIKLESFFRLNRWDKKEWDIIWPTKKWYGKVWWIIFKNKNINQFKKDVQFLETNYLNIIRMK